ncbi:roadblock/LC7 domain-containing protein [Streptomyces sp. CBG31]|uniref:roadblock/LC7 domain-containing protein n=1 Tax=Streptomyces sp. CBG31 TaxID=2762623 RepID=UPI0037D9E547
MGAGALRPVRGPGLRPRGHRGEGAGPSDGPKGSSADLATIVSGIGSLTVGAAKLMDGGGVKQTMVAMDEGSVFVMSISDGSLLGVHATPDCDMSVVAYHMALFVGRAGHVLTPELRSELRKSMESTQ